MGAQPFLISTKTSPASDILLSPVVHFAFPVQTLEASLSVVAPPHHNLDSGFSEFPHHRRCHLQAPQTEQAPCLECGSVLPKKDNAGCCEETSSRLRLLPENEVAPQQPRKHGSPMGLCGTFPSFIFPNRSHGQALKRQAKPHIPVSSFR